MSENNGIMQGMKEAAIFAMFKDVSIERIIELAEAEREGRVVVLPCKPNDVYWHRAYDTGELELNFELHEMRDHDDTYPETKSCAYWE